MRIKTISVLGLFGLFDHVIPLHSEERITIIHAPNGYGKTTILRLIYDIYDGNDIDIFRTNFRTIRLDFDDGSSLDVSKKKKEGSGKAVDLHIAGLRLDEQLCYRYAKPDGEVLEHIPRMKIENLSDIISDLSRLKDTRGFRKDSPAMHASSGSGSDDHRLNGIYLNWAPSLVFSPDDPPKWLINIRNSIPVRFIESQRLYHNVPQAEKSMGDNNPGYERSVSIYRADLINTIEAILSKYAELSQQLDCTFPARLTDLMMRLTDGRIKDDEMLDRDTILKQLKEMDDRRQSLMDVGLLESVPPEPANVSGPMDDHTRLVLSLYLKDTWKKLDIFNDLERRIRTLKNIIEKLFLYKKMVINKEVGFAFRSPDGALLLPDRLSSGEQHELVLCYELLFKSMPGSLFLIDEPEISLHVMWQEQFIRNLGEISKLADIDMLVATHSPQIIDEFWDLAIELKGAV